MRAQLDARGQPAARSALGPWPGDPGRGACESLAVRGCVCALMNARTRPGGGQRTRCSRPPTLRPTFWAFRAPTMCADRVSSASAACALKSRRPGWRLSEGVRVLQGAHWLLSGTLGRHGPPPLQRRHYGPGESQRPQTRSAHDRSIASRGGSGPRRHLPARLSGTKPARVLFALAHCCARSCAMHA